MHRCAAFVLVATSLLAAGCGGDTDEATETPSESVSSGAAQPSQPLVAQGTFTAYAPGATAVTYDPKLVASGATAHVELSQVVDTTAVTLAVRGLTPNRDYGAHLHLRPCGRTAADAGPHYQHHHDPAASASPPSVNPAYANPQNEVWLDFTTDSQGAGSSKSTQSWTFSTTPQSLVIHAKKTQTAPGKAGTAGPRVACLTIPR